MSAHTPGPWMVLPDPLAGGGWIVGDAKHNPIAALEPMFEDEALELANARLITAAPDLLAALEVSRGQWIHSVNAEQCLAAIAKATGAA